MQIPDSFKEPNLPPRPCIFPCPIEEVSIISVVREMLFLLLDLFHSFCSATGPMLSLRQSIAVVIRLNCSMFHSIFLYLSDFLRIFANITTTVHKKSTGELKDGMCAASVFWIQPMTRELLKIGIITIIRTMKIWPCR